MPTPSETRTLRVKAVMGMLNKLKEDEWAAYSKLFSHALSVWGMTKGSFTRLLVDMELAGLIETDDPEFDKDEPMLIRVRREP